MIVERGTGQDAETEDQSGLSDCRPVIIKLEKWLQQIL